MYHLIKIGILGCSQVAERRFLPALKSIVASVEVVGFASRQKSKAEAYQRTFGGVAFDNYESLLASPAINTVYVSTPNALHEEWVLAALNAGKAVICEKPLTTSLASAQKIVDLAWKKKLRVVENYMFLHHPQHQVVRQALESGAIGDLKVFSGCFSMPPLPAHDIRYQLELGGGALLDAGGYPLCAMTHYLGNDLKCSGVYLWNDKERVDVLGTAIFNDSRGRIGQVNFGFQTFYQNYYELIGTKGKLRVERAFTNLETWNPQIRLENENGVTLLESKPSNHFSEAMLSFADSMTRMVTESDFHSLIEQAKLRETVKETASRSLL